MRKAGYYISCVLIMLAGLTDPEAKFVLAGFILSAAIIAIITRIVDVKMTRQERKDAWLARKYSK